MRAHTRCLCLCKIYLYMIDIYFGCEIYIFTMFFTLQSSFAIHFAFPRKIFVCTVMLAGTLDQLSFAANIATTTQSCELILHNIRKDKVLVQVLVIVCLDYCNSVGPTRASDLCTSSRMQQPSWSSTKVLPRYTAPPHTALATGGCSNVIQDTGICLPPTRTWTNHTPHLIHQALLQPISLLFPHNKERPN